MKFYKYQATGNDFILIDNRENSFPNIDIESLCNRRFGIGADGLMLLQNCPEYDFEMVYFNSDGNPSSMCGNGGRCIVQFAHDLRIINNNCTFLAVDGKHQATIKNNMVELQMNNVNNVEIRDNSVYILNTGSPHYVQYFNENIFNIDLNLYAKNIRYNDEFKTEGINVNIAEIINKNTIQMRTYERGVEDETYSCGTGVTAAAISLIIENNQLIDNTKYEINVQTKGGNLTVTFHIQNQLFNNIWLIGNAKKVFEGSL